MAVEGERLSPPGLLISGIVVLAVGFLCLPRLHVEPLLPPLVVGGLWLGALFLQASALELPGIYLFSSAPALSLAAAGLGGNGAGLACLISLSALFLRSLLHRPRGFFYTLQANLADAVPELLTICFMARGAGWTGALAYLPLVLLWSAFMSRADSRLLTSMAVPYAGVACAALVAGNLDLIHLPWTLMPLLAVLAALQRRLPGGVQPTPRRPARSTAPSRRPQQPAKTPAQLALESLPGRLLVCQNSAQVLETVVQAAAAVCPSRSQVLFLPQEGKLVPVRYQSPLQERLASYSLIGLPEPVVEMAWQSHTHVAFPPHPKAKSGNRFFEGEESGAALWLDQEGILYVGRSQPPLSEDEMRSLEAVAARAVTAMRVVRSQESERQALEQYQREHTRLEQELQRLQSLLEGTRQMASTLDIKALGERLEGMLRASIPQDFGAIFTLSQGQLQLHRQWGANPGLNLPAALAVCQPVLSNEIPMTLQPDSRLQPLVLSQTGLVAAPMQLEHGSTGVLIVGSTTGARFEREHQDLLWMIGCLAAISFSNANLHEEVVSTQAQLVHAGKLAAIGQLAAGVAHELNTPLGAIQLSLDGLTRQLKDSVPAAGRKLERASLAADQARQIVDKLLIYSRREDKSDREQVDLSQVVTDSLELVQTQFRRDGVTVEVDLTATPAVLGSSLELRQVLTNLLMNARDAAVGPGASAPDVKIQTRCEDGWVRIQVFDHGPGVDPEIEKRIFEPFFTTKPVGRGTGLGLSISHSIAAKFGGVLEYESPPGGGACFTLRLPVELSPKS